MDGTTTSGQEIERRRWRPTYEEKDVMFMTNSFVHHFCFIATVVVLHSSSA